MEILLTTDFQLREIISVSKEFPYKAPAGDGGNGIKNLRRLRNNTKVFELC
jgi:hypothetical protein